MPPPCAHVCRRGDLFRRLVLWCTGVGNQFRRPILWCIEEVDVSFGDGREGGLGTWAPRLLPFCVRWDRMEGGSGTRTPRL